MVWPCEKKECGRTSKEMWTINIPVGFRGRGRPKKSLDEVIRGDLKVVGLTEDMAQDRRLWQDRIKVVDRGAMSA